MGIINYFKKFFAKKEYINQNQIDEEFYSIIKLTSGEEILSLVSIDENDGDPLIILQNPITIKIIETPHGVPVSYTHLRAHET